MRSEEFEEETKRQRDEETKCATPSLRLSVSPSLLSPLSSLASRLRRSRGGSVLIIVIVLLLLLAILGAAYLSTTRSDRVASAQNVVSGDLDTTLSGIADICNGIIVDDLNDTFGDLRGNTASGLTTPTNNGIVNRNVFQGEGQGKINTPNVAPTVYPIGVNATYNIGDIVNTTDYPNLFCYYYNPNAGSTFIVSATTPIVPTAPAAGGIPVPNTWQLLNGHLPFTAYGADPWLADRIPRQDASLGSNAIYWQYITQSIQISAAYPQGAPMSILGTPFVDPSTGQAITGNLNQPLAGVSITAPPPPFPQYLAPTFNTLINGAFVPAFKVGPSGTVFLAADADGDGIADSLFFAVPGMTLDGLSWYAAVRIIDNNSAINANTAWSRDQEYIYPGGGVVPTGTPNIWNLFQTSVGLLELINLSDGSNFKNLLNYRFNNSTSSTTYAAGTQTPEDEAAINGTTPGSAAARPDYNFTSEGEAFYQQFIRRIANPGYAAVPTAGSPLAGRYQALPISDETALAYHFCLVNPEAILSQGSSNNPSLGSSIIESLLPYSLTTVPGSTPPQYYRSTPYGNSVNPALTDVGQWFNDNFNYITPSSSTYGFQSLRPLLVTRNPVSNYIQQVYNNNNGGSNATSYSVPNYYPVTPVTAATQPSIADPILPNYMLPYSGPTNAHFKGAWSSTAAYGQNDIVVYPGPNPPINPLTGNPPGGPYNGPSYTFIAVQASTDVPPINKGQLVNGVMVNSTTPPIPAVNTQYWQLQPWSLNPVKANVNTATFRELFRDFWCVMAGNPSNATPFGYTADTTSAFGIYDDSATNPQFMFRSPLRDPTSAAPETASELDGPATTQPSKTTTNTNTMLLRAALAAVNTMGLRDNTQNIISRTIILKNAFVLGGNTGGGAAANTDVEVRVYSNAPQPFISEVYLNTNTGADPSGNGTNPAGYVAVELFNPYPVPLTLINWTLALVNRPASGVYPKLQLTPIATIGATGTAPVVIPPHGYLLLENCNFTPDAQAATTQPSTATAPDAAAAIYRPVDSGILPTLGTGGPWAGPAVQSPPATQPTITAYGSLYQDVYVPYLENVIQGTTTSTGTTSPGGELVLLRPRRADGQPTTYIDPANPNAAGSESFDENPATNPNYYVSDLVPVDSYDFTNATLGISTAYTVWNYVRAKGDDNNGNFLFRTTYPGTYNATLSPARQGGTLVVTYGAVAPTTQPWASTTQPSATPSPVFGQSSPGSVFVGGTSLLPPPVQIYNVGSIASGISSHFPNPPVASNASGGTVVGTASYLVNTPPYHHPLGGFARNGDMLDIPNIGAYRIRVVDATDTLLVYPPTTAVVGEPWSSPYFLELNSLPMDCSFALINDPTAPYQNIGRFVPLAATYAYVTAIQSLTPPAGLTSFPLPDYYAWARNLFNYLTVQSSTDTYFPNYDPNLSSSVYPNPSASTAVPPTFAYPPQNSPPVSPLTANYPPSPVLTANAAATDQTAQDNVGVDGLININTASWKVLSMLPLVPNNPGNTQTLAQAIVLYRDGDGTTKNLPHGPFTSIFDLNEVPGFQTAESAFTPVTPSSSVGLLSPADPNFETTSANTSQPLGTEEDYQGDCLELTRISNLITTRSDTFTVYIVVQGWQNVGVPQPGNPNSSLAVPVITRRFAYIVDRNAINSDPNTRYLKTLTVPNN